MQIHVPIPFIVFALFFSSPPSRNSDPGSHGRLFSPLPATVHALQFYREKISALSSLVDSRRIAATQPRRSERLFPFFLCTFISLYIVCTRRSQQMILSCFGYIANKFKISPRRDSNSRTNTTIYSSIRGLPLDHRGDRFTPPMCSPEPTFILL